MIKNILVCGVLSVLSWSAVASSASRGYVAVQDAEFGEVTSEQVRIILNYDGATQKDQDRAWSFYYSFVYNIETVSERACFRGDPNTAIKSLVNIIQSEVSLHNSEVKTVRHIHHDRASDSIIFARMNTRAEKEADRTRYILVRLPRCGGPATGTQLESLDRYYSTTQSLKHLFGLKTWKLTSLIDMRYSDSITPIAKSETCKVYGDSTIRKNLAANTTLGDIAVYRPFDTSDYSIAVQYSNLDNFHTTSIHAKTETEDGPFRIKINCDLPLGSTVEDLQEALKGIFEIKQK